MKIKYIYLIMRDVFSGGGLSTQLIASDYVNLVVSAIGIVTALILLSPKNYPQIMELWKEKWSR